MENNRSDKGFWLAAWQGAMDKSSTNVDIFRLQLTTYVLCLRVLHAILLLSTAILRMAMH